MNMWKPQVSRDEDTNTRIGIAVHAAVFADLCALGLLLTALPVLQAVLTLGLIVAGEALFAVAAWGIGSIG